jgi:hypothetical protein
MLVVEEGVFSICHSDDLPASDSTASFMVSVSRSRRVSNIEDEAYPFAFTVPVCLEEG